MKTRVRKVVADALHVSGINAVLRRVRTRSLVILCYHRVLPAEGRAEYPLPELVVTPEALARHVQYCRERYECLPLREAIHRLRFKTQPHRPLLTFTFDDGYADNFQHARPVLNAQDVRATFFVISALVGSDMPPWYDRLARTLTRLNRSPFDAEQQAPEVHVDGDRRIGRLDGNGRPWHVHAVLQQAKQLPVQEREEMLAELCERAGNESRCDAVDRIMNHDEVIALARSGHEVGSHTRSHPILTRVNPEELVTEVETSRGELSTLLGEEVVSFAYPNGSYNDEVLAEVRRAGYRYAVTTESGLNKRTADPLRLHRLFISQERLSGPNRKPSSNLLDLELTGLADAVFLRRARRGAV